MKKTISAFVLSLFIAVSSAEATTVSFDFSGKWTDVSPELSTWFTLGNSFQGQLSYDTDVKPAITQSTNSQYPAGITLTFTTTAGNASSANTWSGTSTKPTITIFDDPDNWQNDQLVANFSNITYKIPSTYIFTYGYLSLTDSDNSVFNDTSLPLFNATSTALMPFDFGMFGLNFIQISSLATTAYTPTYLTVLGSIDTPHPTPEPASITLFATGFASLTFARRRRLI